MELEQYRERADGPTYTEWLSRQGAGFPGSKEAREVQSSKIRDGAEANKPNATESDPLADGQAVVRTDFKRCRDCGRMVLSLSFMGRCLQCQGDWQRLQNLQMENARNATWHRPFVESLDATESDPAAEPPDPSTDASTPSVTTAGTPREAKGTTETLTRNDRKLIRAMRNIGAVDEEHPVARVKITAKARTGYVESHHNQESFRRLKRMGLIDSGRRVGTWLTPKGLSAPEDENL